MKIAHRRMSIALAVLVLLLVTALAWWSGNRPLAQTLPLMAVGICVALSPRWRARQPHRNGQSPTTAKQD